MPTSPGSVPPWTRDPAAWSEDKKTGRKASTSVITTGMAGTSTTRRSRPRTEGRGDHGRRESCAKHPIVLL